MTLSVTDKYAQPEVLAFWQKFGQQGLQACEQAMLTRYTPPPATVLDLGCGSGRAGMVMMPQGYKVVSLDITWGMAEATQQLHAAAGLPTRTLQADMLTIPHTPASFDVVLILIAALQHIRGRKARQAALAEIGRVLKPNGRLILALDNLAPALTCYAWWGWRKVRQVASSSGQSKVGGNGRSVPVAQSEADAQLASQRQKMSALGWHARGLLRTLRWRTWPYLADLGKQVALLPGEIGDTNINQVSMPPTPGMVYYHLYRHNELLDDAAASGFKLLGYHSGRELDQGDQFIPLVRQLDKQILYAFERTE